jgi:UDP-N-acetyl-D-galactosamine dehydrogenase
VTQRIEDRVKIAVVGLGYVGLPLAVALSRKYDVVGFDISAERVAALREGRDSTNEVTSEDLRQARLSITEEPDDLRGSSLFIITVPNSDRQRSPPGLWSDPERLRNSGPGWRRAQSSCSKARFTPAPPKRSVGPHWSVHRD